MMEPILITGCQRSGASIIANALQMCGAYGGEVSIKNMFENQRIKTIERSYLTGYGDPDGQYPLPIADSLEIPVVWRNSIESVIEYDGYERGIWFYKSSLIALIWPVWQYAFPNARWIIIRRNTEDIIQSCMKTKYMKAFSEPDNRCAIGVDSEKDGWLWWVSQYEQLFVDVIKSGINCKVIWPERMVRGDYTQLYETLEWLGLPWKSEVLNMIDPLLWHSRQKVNT